MCFQTISNTIVYAMKTPIYVAFLVAIQCFHAVIRFFERKKKLLPPFLPQTSLTSQAQGYIFCLWCLQDIQYDGFIFGQVLKCLVSFCSTLAVNSYFVCIAFSALKCSFTLFVSKLSTVISEGKACAHTVHCHSGQVYFVKQ